MKILLLVLLLTGLPASADSNEASTRCSLRSFQAEYRVSAAVFVGEVVKMNESEGKKYFVFKVKKFWKGVRSEHVKVFVRENARFQSPFEEGKTFLVFAKKDDDGVLRDGRCSHSAEIDGTSSTLKDDLEKLGKGKTCIDLAVKGDEVEKSS
ncbi:MAG: hypothetical protein HKN33_08795 [Pyrinomonadaceae bacterium]|nr:hypothetical protein [Pyrinomonadaceae bacterium]